MPTRREMMAMGAALASLGPVVGPVEGRAAELGDDGMHKQPWFTDSFLELGDDLATAAGQGRHLMILFEQNGCPYCRELHRVNFARAEIVEMIKANFDVIQLNMFGSREVLDFDGQALEEKALAEKWGVNFTPTTLIFHQKNVGAKDRAAAETFRLPGYLKPFHYLSSLEYVESGAFEGESFQRYLQGKFEALRAQGIDPDVW
ncbi:thioredoxin family protein [Rhodobacteraceae bacterium D3-12]|nr:thioredoxin family protein [Rhodobacteraceae bacterium D3-12]